MPRSRIQMVMLLAALVTSLIPIVIIPASGTNPPVVDSNSIVATSSAGTSNTITLSTSNPNDLILVYTTLNNSPGNGIPITSISDTAGLSWLQREALFSVDVGYVYEYYAVSLAVLSNDVINVTASGSEARGVSIVAVALSGARLTNPFDPGPGIPSYLLNTNNQDPSLSVTTTLTETVIISFDAQSHGCCTDMSPNTPLSLIVRSSSVGGSFLLGSASYGPPSTGSSILSWTAGGLATNGAMGLEVVQASISQPSSSGGARGPSTSGSISTLSGPGGLPIPPQLADKGVLSFIGLVSGIILLSAIPTVEKQKKRKDSFI